MMIGNGWVVFRSMQGEWVAINRQNEGIEADTLDELIIKVDQADNPERCSE